MAKFLTHQGKVLVPVAWKVGTGFHGFSVDLESDHIILIPINASYSQMSLNKPYFLKVKVLLGSTLQSNETVGDYLLSLYIGSNRHTWIVNTVVLFFQWYCWRHMAEGSSTHHSSASISHSIGPRFDPSFKFCTSHSLWGKLMSIPLDVNRKCCIHLLLATCKKIPRQLKVKEAQAEEPFSNALAKWTDKMNTATSW